MEIVSALFAIAILVLAWAIYRVHQQVLTLREKIVRLGKRVNDVLYKATRGGVKKQENAVPKSMVDFKKEAEKGEKRICPICHSLCPADAWTCPTCGARLPKKPKRYDWDKGYRSE